MLKAANSKKMSADKGKFRVPLPESNYRVTVEKVGFKKQKLIITLAKGESTDLNIARKKELLLKTETLCKRGFVLFVLW